MESLPPLPPRVARGFASAAGQAGAAGVTLPLLRARYATGALTPVGLARDLAARLERKDNAWIHLEADAALLARAHAIEDRFGSLAPASRPPLYGVPFAVKDNIDVAGVYANWGRAAVVGMPARAILSLIANGTPYSGKLRASGLSSACR